MDANHKYKTAFGYFGGKIYHLDNLYKYFPPHDHFVDLFCGSAAVTINKKPSKLETINDINGHIVNFFRVLRERPGELIEKLQLTPYARDEFKKAWQTMNDQNENDLERARCFFIRQKQGFGGSGVQHENCGFKKRIDGQTTNNWGSDISSLKNICQRLLNVQIENKDYRDLFSVVNVPGVFIYADPPYVQSTRKSKRYAHDMNDLDQLVFIQTMSRAKCHVMISGYDNELYDTHLKGYRKISFGESFNNNGYASRTECIWINYEPGLINGQFFLL